VLKELDRRYVATVTTASTGVGASAAIPGVGVPIALGLGVADLLFFTRRAPYTSWLLRSSTGWK
jgi:hypothetical protein